MPRSILRLRCLLVTDTFMPDSQEFVVYISPTASASALMQMIINVGPTKINSLGLNDILLWKATPLTSDFHQLDQFDLDKSDGTVLLTPWPKAMVIKPGNAVGRYFEAQFDTQSMMGIHLLVQCSASTPDCGMDEMRSSIQRIEASQSRLEASQSNNNDLIQSVANLHSIDHSIVQSLSTVALAILDSELAFDAVDTPPTTNFFSREKFRVNIQKAYALPKHSYYKYYAGGKIGLDIGKSTDPHALVSFDMATGRVLPSSVVVASHIFQHRWKQSLNALTNFQSFFINHPCNGLLLYKPVEHALDCGQLCIDVEPAAEDGYTFKFRLLDESIRSKSLTQKAQELRVGTATNTSSEIGQDFDTTFGDLNGQTLHWPPNTKFRPSKRLLALHGAVSTRRAQ